MANVNEKFGLRPYRSLNGAPWNNAQNRYTIANNLSTAIFQGDPVKPTTAGNVTLARSNTSDRIVGVFNGVFYNDPSTQKPTFRNNYPGSIAVAGITAFVVDDPNTVYLVDANAAFTRADLFKNYSLTNVTGNTLTGISEKQLAVGTSGLATTFAVQAIDIQEGATDSDTSTSGVNVLVRINNHFYRSGTAGI
ncbi:MAG TPA: hypothetical protein PLI52_03565 [Prochlorococcaceae cyanobacterium AMR_MDS_5431]|nr:hypothetical protein [Prochlorococcaceae cyanobacterium AMR_MDS_5431]